MSIPAVTTTVIPCEICARDEDLVIGAVFLLPQADANDAVEQYLPACEKHLVGWFDDTPRDKAIYYVIQPVLAEAP